MDTTEKKKILVVDDNEIQLKLCEILLKDEYDVTTLKSGKEAMDYLVHGYIPNLILLDILMPNMDGWETYNRLRAISFLQNVPIIFVTSLQDAFDRNRAHEMGAADYIVKPLVREDFLDRIKKEIDKQDNGSGEK